MHWNMMLFLLFGNWLYRPSHRAAGSSFVFHNTKSHQVVGATTYSIRPENSHLLLTYLLLSSCGPVEHVFTSSYVGTNKIHFLFNKLEVTSWFHSGNSRYNDICQRSFVPGRSEHFSSSVLRYECRIS